LELTRQREELVATVLIERLRERAGQRGSGRSACRRWSGRGGFGRLAPIGFAARSGDPNCETSDDKAAAAFNRMVGHPASRREGLARASQKRAKLV